MTQEPDLNLLRSHNGIAWGDAFRRLWPIAMRGARGVMGDDSELADIAQKTLSVLPRYVETCASWMELCGLAREIARRQALKLVRHRRQRVRDVTMSVPIDSIAAEELNDAHKDVTSKLDVWTILDSSLEAGERDLVEAIHLKGMNSTEVAAISGETPSAVRGRLLQAMNKIRLWVERTDRRMDVRVPLWSVGPIWLIAAALGSTLHRRLS